MKKILLSIIICILMLNITVKAESQKEKINIYFFHGNGCPHCEDATKFFDSIKEKYGENGYAKVYLEDKEFEDALDKLRQALSNKEEFMKRVEKLVKEWSEN